MFPFLDKAIFLAAGDRMFGPETGAAAVGVCLAGSTRGHEISYRGFFWLCVRVSIVPFT